MADGRVRIDEGLVRRLLSEQFPQWADLPLERVPGGWDNRMFRLGEGMAARLPSADPYAHQAEKEERWLPILAPRLPLPVPAPLALGAPSEAFPRPWSVQTWLPGESAADTPPVDLTRFAADLGGFLTALQGIDAGDGPAPGPHNFHRGGPLSTYDREVRWSLERLGGRIDVRTAEALWEEGLGAERRGPPVWLHGDVHPTNLLVRDGRLSAVIDWGSCGVGDPACDYAIAWTMFEGESRAAFRAASPSDDGAWKRGRGWALWKALIVLAGLPGTNPAQAEPSRRVVDAVLAEVRTTAKS